MTKRTKSELLLLFAAAVWGFAFVAQRAGMKFVGPLTYTAVRFAMGSALLAVILLVKRNHPAGETNVRPLHITKNLFYWASLCGLVLFCAACAQQMGIQYTTAGKAGFITGLYVIMVPIIGLFLKQKPPVTVWIGSFLATAGLYLLCITDTLRLSTGDALVLLCAFLFSIHILIIGHISDRADPILIACIQFAVCSVVSFGFAFALETVRIGDILDAAVPIFYGGFISVGVGYTIQVVSQRHIPPAPASIIMSLETVFAAVGGFVASFFSADFADELLSLRAMAGCALMLLGMVLAQVPAHKPAVSKTQ